MPRLPAACKIVLILYLLAVSGIPAIPARSLVFWDFKYTDPTTQRAMNRVDRLFREANPDVELDHVGFFDQEYIPSLKAALLAGTGPDVLMLHSGVEFNELHQYLEVLNSAPDRLAVSFRPASLEACRTTDGALKALPLTVQGMGWYYNKQLFVKAGLNPSTPPEDWNEFLEACRILRDADVVPIASGNNRPLTTDFIRRSLTTAFFTDREIEELYGRGRGISTDRYRTIVEFCRVLRDAGYLHEEGLFRPYFNYALETFMSGEAAMFPGLISDIAHWKDFSDALGADNVGYFPNLRHDDMARPGAQLVQDAGVIICINSTSEHKELALEYVLHLFSDASQRIFTEDLGLLPPLVDSTLPMDSYPVLEDIRDALSNPGIDPELHIPSRYISDLQYRLDDLLINTREITVDEYLIKLRDELRLY